jgi:hypothetical protein
VVGPSNEKWNREQWLEWGKLGGRRKVGEKSEHKKPPSKFDIARIIADEVP